MKRRRIHTWMLGRHLPYVSRHTYEEEDTYIHMRRRIHTWMLGRHLPYVSRISLTPPQRGSAAEPFSAKQCDTYFGLV